MAHKVDAVVIRSQLQELGKTQYKRHLTSFPFPTPWEQG